MEQKSCLIVGASHAGVACAFALRKKGWQGSIVLFDKDNQLPYHKPPLSKSLLSNQEPIEEYRLKGEEAYEKNDIELRLGVEVNELDTEKQTLQANGEAHRYDYLVLATGASPIIPAIAGIEDNEQVYYLRNVHDAQRIQAGFEKSTSKRVAVIGGGYIGLEVAASLNKLGGKVTLIERESRLLSRVSTQALSDYFHDLHHEKGVELVYSASVTAYQNGRVICDNGFAIEADQVIIGVGVKPRIDLAATAGIATNNGIVTNAAMQTNLSNVYAIGDNCFHYNKWYQKNLRIESVQNATDQAKVAASNICGEPTEYEALPWFWSDQYDTKLQIVGLFDGFDQQICRRVKESEKLSNWYFKKGKLICVEAINNPKAYVIGTKVIKQGIDLDLLKLADTNCELRLPAISLSH